MLTKAQKELIAVRNNVKLRFVYELLDGSKFTTIPNLALDLAKLTGKKPIEYFNPNKKQIRKLALAAHPELNKKVNA